MRLKFVGLLLLASLPALAHHYICYYIDVKDESGNVPNWAFEGYPPNTLRRGGFSRDSMEDPRVMTGPWTIHMTLRHPRARIV